MVRKRTLPKHVSWAQDRHGKMRLRFKRKIDGRWQSGYLPTPPYSDEFNKAYHALLSDTVLQKEEIGSSRTTDGTMNAARVAYIKSSRFQSLAPSSRKTFQGVLDRFCQNYGDNRLSHLERKHVQAILNGMPDRPQAANRLVSVLRQVFDNAIALGMMRDNPAYNIRKYSQKTSGFHSWTDQEIQQFQTKWEIGTRERLAFDLLFLTGQRRSDVVRMGWQHITDGNLHIIQQKTGTEVIMPVQPDLFKSLNAVSLNNMTFLTTSNGAPFTAAGFGNWFRKACNKASLKHCASHGLRKAFTRIAAEKGSTANEIIAMTGHINIQEVTTYTRAADRKKMAASGMTKILSTSSEQKIGQPNAKVGKNTKKEVKEQ